MMIGTLQRRHLPQVHGDRLGLSALFRADAGVRALRVDEAEDRQLELLRELHHPQRLAEPFRLRLAEVAGDLLLRVAALLVPDHADRHAAEPAEAGHDGGVVAELAVAVDLDPVLDQRWR